MNFVNVLLIGFTFLFLVVGIDQAIVLGFQHSYWAFMLSLAAFFGYNYRRSKLRKERESTPGRTGRESKKKK